jgi:hypothetical protein
MRRPLIAAALVGLLLPATAVADPGASGPAGSGVQLEQNAVDENGNPIPEPLPIATNENGAAMYLSQDGGDGEHASIVVANSVRDGLAGRSPSTGNVEEWQMGDFAESAADEGSVTFTFRSGDHTYTLLLTEDGE